MAVGKGRQSRSRLADRTLIIYDSATDSLLMIFANRSPANLESIVAPELALIASALKP